MSDQPTLEQLAAAVERALPGSGDVVRAVIAHGSWVRKDFWPPIEGQRRRSDVDLIVVGVGSSNPDTTARRLHEDQTLGVTLDAWRISEAELQAIRDQRPPGQPVPATKNGLFDINGFDLVQHHRTVWGDASRDPLLNFPVPLGNDLARIAMARLCDLKAEFIDPRFRDELNRVACDALKAAGLFFLVRAGRSPTRNKREILDRFSELVPNFPGRDETAHAIWCLYEDGQRRVCGSDAEARGTFVAHLVELSKEHAFR